MWPYPQHNVPLPMTFTVRLLSAAFFLVAGVSFISTAHARTDSPEFVAISIPDSLESPLDSTYRKRRHFRFRRPGYRAAYVGDYSFRWPYREAALYRPIPAIRYNRVEGLVLGLVRQPLSFDDYARGRIFGQVGYAFALDAWRYEVGAESRLRGGDFALKTGVSYRRNTVSEDVWKSSWAENSLAAFLFKSDFFDYYEVRGWSAYAVQQITSLVQLSAGFRGETYHSLDRNANWALFGGSGFRANPLVDEGLMHSFVFAGEGGRVRGFDHLPSGAAFRIEAELGEGLGGDFSFNRLLADGRVYLPATSHSSLSMRLRGGVASDGAPIQKYFTMGGIGTVRGYPINAFGGTRMLLGNVEYAVDDVSLFDELLNDLQVFGFADAGWVNDRGTNHFRMDDLLTSVGVGIGFDDRLLRLELAFPLVDTGIGRSPTLWFRLNPTF
jgi:hypothetical protein